MFRRNERLYADYKQAVGLLKEDLVWSSDFDNIRLDLVDMISRHADNNIFPNDLTKLVQKLIQDENDLTI